MKAKFYLTFFLCLSVFISCSQEEDLEPVFDFGGVDSFMLTPEQGSKTIIEFTSSLDWTAKISPASTSWLTLSSTQGGGGTAKLTVTATSPNDTGEERTATVVFTSGQLTKNITVKQSSLDAIILQQTDYKVSAEGGKIKLYMSTALSVEHMYYKIWTDWDQNSNWIDFVPNNTSRSLVSYISNLQIKPNTDKSARVGKILFSYEDGAKKYYSDTIIVVQSGTAETSTDMRAEDGKVITLQTHTQGKGVPLVIMGDGFIDKEISNGYYRTVMEKSMESFFTEEPVKSLRNYFDVYMVQAVSLNNGFGGDYKTAFSCQLKGENTTEIEGDDKACMNYVSKVSKINLNEALAIVILNTPRYAGTTFFGYSENNQYVEFSIAFCPIIESLESEKFRSVLCHEAIGHGFAKLYDEYSYEDQGTIPAKEIDLTRSLQKIGWAMNVDFTSNRNQVIWKHFLTDSRYTWENLGVIEGACTYIKGAYRPTDKSMMRGNDERFNAPSREAIYKRVMKTSSSTTWTYDYETFVAFDLAHVNKAKRMTRVVSVSDQPFASPRFMNKPLIKK